MTHEDLRKIVETGLGKPVAFDARPHLAKFIASRATEISLRYDWIKNPEIYRVTYQHPHLDADGGVEWITFRIHEAGSQTPGGGSVGVGQSN